MNPEKRQLINEICDLAKKAEAQGYLPEASILYSLQGASVTNKEKELAAIVQLFIKFELARLQDNCN